MDHLKKILCLFCVILIMAVAGCASSSSDDETAAAEENIPDGAFQAGANVAKLVPSGSQAWWEEYNIYLGGFGLLSIRGGKSGKAQGVNDPPYVRSMVIEQGSQKIAFAVIDACVIGNKIIKEIKTGVSDNTGIPESNVYVAVTHSHSSLDLLSAYGGVSKEYRKFLINTAVKSVMNADESKAPARLFVSSVQYKPSVIKKSDGAAVVDQTGNPVRWVYNRRGWPSLDEMYSNPDADFTINVIEARDYVTDKTLGAIVNYGAHPVLVLPETFKFSRDFCGYMIDYVQKKLGAPAVFIQGTMGDINPGDWDMLEMTPDNCYGFAKQFGEDVAVQALASMKSQTAISSEMHVEQAQIKDFTIDNILLMALLKLTDAFLQSDIEMDYRKNNLISLKADTQVTYIRLGKQLQIAMLPGEALTHMGLGVKEGEHQGRDGNDIPPFTGIKEVMTAPFKMVTSLTGDELIYLVPSQEWKNSLNQADGENNYEEMMSMSLEGKLADDCREAAISLIKKDK
jgi:hypothetical protein